MMLWISNCYRYADSINTLNGRCEIIPKLMYDHANNGKTQLSFRRHKSECTFHESNAENAYYERYLFMKYHFASQQNNPNTGI